MLKRLIASTALALSLSLPAQALPIVYAEGGAPVDIPGLTGFATTGAMMDGLRVVACFSVAGCAPALFWADTGATSGGVTGAGWSLSVTGDTFNVNAWTFTFDDPNQTNLGQLVSLLLDGSSGLTVFDRTFGGADGTAGSEAGRDFDTAVGGLIDVLYGGPTGIGGALPVGDLFQSVFIDFHTEGPRTSFVFSQDTDNDSRFQAPEPGSLALLAIGALGLGLARRRR